MVIVPGGDQLAPSKEHSVHDALAQRVRVLHHGQSGRRSQHIGHVLRVAHIRAAQGAKERGIPSAFCAGATRTKFDLKVRG